jgi:hypothetical protein
MLQLVKYELYKLISKRLNILAFVAFILLYFLFLSQFNLGDIELVKKMYSEWGGPLTEEKVDLARQEQHNLRVKMEEAWEEHVKKHPPGEAPAFVDETYYLAKISLYSDIINRWERFQIRSAILAELKEEIRHGEAAGRKDFGYQKNVMHYNMLSGTQPPRGDYFQGWGQIIDFVNTFGFVILGALILLALSPVFSEEYAVNMDSLILSSRHGRKKIVTAKIAAALITVFGCAVILLILNVAVNGMRFGLDGSQAALQELYKYRHSPFNLNISQYFFIQQATHIFGAASFGLLVLLISALSRSSLNPFFIGGAVYGIPIFLGSILRIEASWARALVDFSYTQMVKVEQLFMTFRTFNVFGYPVLYVYLLYAVIALLSAAVLAGIYRVFRSRQVC